MDFIIGSRRVLLALAVLRIPGMNPNRVAASGQKNTLAPGTLLAGRYRLERVIGIGGMGAVYIAYDERFRTVARRCAVKEMFDQLLDDASRNQALQNFEREANILASLSHPSIPKVFDFFTEDHRHYLVMEYVDGQDLEQIRRSAARPLSPDRVVPWALQLCEVLDYLHRQNPPIIFRDLKPSNIMLGKDERLMLVDFGIAKHFQNKDRGTMIGTEGYAPPEQYEGVSDPRVDIYGLGATLHQLLTDTNPQEFRPFSFNTRSIRQYNPEVTPELEAVVMRALAYTPEERWGSAAEMGAALRAVTERPGEQVGNHPPTTARPLPRESDRLATPRTQSWIPTAPVQAAGVAPRPEMGRGVVPLWRFVCEEEVRASPAVHNGRLFVGSYDYNLYCLDARTGAFVWKFPTGGGITGRPALDETLVITGSEDHQVYALDRETGAPVWSFATRGRVRSSPRISQDRVFIGSDDGSVYAIDCAQGWQLWNTRIGAPMRSSAAVTSDLLIIGSEDGVLYALETAQGEIKWRVRTNGPIVSSPAVNDERVVVGSFDWTVYGIDPASGWVIWRFRCGDIVVSSPALVGNRAYVGSVDGSVICLDTEWGKMVWRQRLGGQVTSSPAVAGGYVYVGCVDGGIYCLNAASGAIVWRFQTGGPVPSSPTVVDDVVYVGSTDHSVYALPAER